MKIAIMGFGVVGSGVGEIISTTQESLKKRCGEDIEVASILDLRDFPDSEYKCFTKDFNDILNNDEIGLVVEVMGGTKPAYDFTKQLLLKGKHVVTSNKELVAKHGTELLQIAKDKNINYLFEASVGGGIPIIRPLYSSLVSNELTDIIGILNGTTNYILTQMIKEGKGFEEALKSAQEKGYAEKDPTADVEGFDTCRKIAILTSLAFGKFVNSEDIDTEGITNITLEDVEYAEAFGGVIKLVGMSKRTEDGAYARVCPVILKKDHPLAGIDDVFNGILVKGDALGDVMFYGRGAGSLPTASAVVSDVVDIIKHKNTHIILGWTEGEDGYLLDSKKQGFRYYVRVAGSSDSAAFCKDGFNVVCLDGEKYADEFAIFTPEMTGEEFEEFKNSKLSAYDIKGSIRLVTD